MDRRKLVQSVKEKLESSGLEGTNDTEKQKILTAIQMRINGRPLEEIPLKELQNIELRLIELLGKGHGRQEFSSGFVPASKKQADRIEIELEKKSTSKLKQQKAELLKRRTENGPGPRKRG